MSYYKKADASTMFNCGAGKDLRASLWTVVEGDPTSQSQRISPEDGWCTDAEAQHCTYPIKNRLLEEPDAGKTGRQRRRKMRG